MQKISTSRRRQRVATVGPFGPTGRRVFTISFDRRGEWKCKERGGALCIWQRIGEDKRAFIERCASFVRSYPLTQLIVKTKAGRIAFERTYPRASDPKRSPG